MGHAPYSLRENAMALSTTDKRRRRTHTQSTTLIKQIYFALEEDHPQSTRHVFYQMTNPRLAEPVEKTEQGYVQVQRRIVEMRREKMIPYSWIVDTTRAGFHVQTYNDASEFVASVAGLYRGDLWQRADYYCEVWCESRSLAGVLRADCRELAVSLYPCGGFPSDTLVYEAGAQINQQDKKSVVIFYVGDYDPAGVLIDISLEQKLRGHLNPGINLSFTRLGINQDQIVEYDLPRKPRKVGERRRMDIEEAVEAEALPAHIMRHLVRNQVEALLPPGELKVMKVAEEAEKEQLMMMARMFETRQ
jgi:hypothetical protein